jgi:branched-chain amino acid transport system permease protein
VRPDLASERESPRAAEAGAGGPTSGRAALEPRPGLAGGRRAGLAGPLVAAVALYAGALAIRHDYYVDMAFHVLLWAALASAWNLVGGFAGQLALGHAAFFGTGAYASTLLLVRAGVSPWLGMFVGAAVAAVFALGLGGATLRLKGPFFAMTTAAFAELVRIAAVNWEALTGGTRGLWIPWEPNAWNFAFRDRRAYVLGAVTLALVVTATAARLSHGAFGYALRSLKEDEDAARSIGVRVTRVKLTTFVVSAALTALGGALYATYLLSIDPPSVLSFDLSVQMALMAVIGGVGTLAGPLLGALAVVTTSHLLRGWLGGHYGALHLLIYGALLIVFMLFLPAGLVGLLRSLRRRLGSPRRGRVAPEGSA